MEHPHRQQAISWQRLLPQLTILLILLKVSFATCGQLSMGQYANVEAIPLNLHAWASQIRFLWHYINDLQLHTGIRDWKQLAPNLTNLQKRHVKMLKSNPNQLVILSFLANLFLMGYFKIICTIFQSQSRPPILRITPSEAYCDGWSSAWSNRVHGPGGHCIQLLIQSIIVEHGCIK